jgi:GNAT superfamily N-acetyltransferase
MHVSVTTVEESDLYDLLPLIRSYCDFYDVAPPDGKLIALSRSLLADPADEGIQLIARDDHGRIVGFATLYWSWSTFTASRIAILHDLFVSPDARRSGVAQALMTSCRDKASERGAQELTWQTAKDNAVAQSLYERLGAQRSEWVDYSLSL